MNTFYIYISDNVFYELGSESMNVFYGEPEFEIVEQILNSCETDEQKEVLNAKCIIDDNNVQYTINDFLNKLEKFKEVRLQQNKN